MQLNSTFEDLLKLYNENRFSHCYLFETNNIEMCFNSLKSFIKIICNDVPNINELIDKNEINKEEKIIDKKEMYFKNNRTNKWYNKKR